MNWLPVLGRDCRPSTCHSNTHGPFFASSIKARHSISGASKWLCTHFPNIHGEFTQWSRTQQRDRSIRFRGRARSLQIGLPPRHFSTLSRLLKSKNPNQLHCTKRKRVRPQQTQLNLSVAVVFPKLVTAHEHRFHEPIADKCTEAIHRLLISWLTVLAGPKISP